MMRVPFLVALLCLQPIAEAAAPLRDPTRPPDWQGEGAAGQEGAEGPVQLEAVLRPRQGRATATISGTLVRQGEEFRGSRLISVREDAVILEGPEGRQTLRLSPAVERPIRGPAKPAGGK